MVKENRKVKEPKAEKNSASLRNPKEADAAWGPVRVPQAEA